MLKSQISQKSQAIINQSNRANPTSIDESKDKLKQDYFRLQPGNNQIDSYLQRKKLEADKFNKRSRQPIKFQPNQTSKDYEPILDQLAKGFKLNQQQAIYQKKDSDLYLKGNLVVDQPILDPARLKRDKTPQKNKSLTPSKKVKAGTIESFNIISSFHESPLINKFKIGAQTQAVPSMSKLKSPSHRPISMQEHKQSFKGNQITTTLQKIQKQIQKSNGLQQKISDLLQQMQLVNEQTQKLRSQQRELLQNKTKLKSDVQFQGVQNQIEQYEKEVRMLKLQLQDLKRGTSIQSESELKRLKELLSISQRQIRQQQDDILIQQKVKNHLNKKLLEQIQLTKQNNQQMAFYRKQGDILSDQLYEVKKNLLQIQRQIQIKRHQNNRPIDQEGRLQRIKKQRRDALRQLGQLELKPGSQRKRDQLSAKIQAMNHMIQSLKLIKN